jgi:hypothetical protein
MAQGHQRAAHAQQLDPRARGPRRQLPPGGLHGRRSHGLIGHASRFRRPPCGGWRDGHPGKEGPHLGGLCTGHPRPQAHDVLLRPGGELPRQQPQRLLEGGKT